jgi:helicase
MDVDDLTAYGGTEQLIKILAEAGFGNLYPPQEMAVKAGLLAGRDSFVVAAPTASGKTLIAEMAAVQVLLAKGGKVLYLVPLRALAREKFEHFSQRYQSLGLRMALSTGDYDSSNAGLEAADLIVTTNEKFDSLLRHRAAWSGKVALVVADEIHLLGDPYRGPTLEIVLTRLRWLNPRIRFIALSATITNAPDIARWLGARLIESDWRPVPLREGVYFNQAITFGDGTVRPVIPEGQVPTNLALEILAQRGQSLVFVSTRKGAESLAARAAGAVSRLLWPEEKASLQGLAEKVLSPDGETTRVCRRLARCLARGVAFHHAGIRGFQRRLIEEAFGENRIRLVVATTTLAMGLNLPARLVVIRDWRRFGRGSGWQPIPVLEIKQMSGRAGRPGLDPYGEAVLVARNKRDRRYLFDTYLGGHPEPIVSRLGREAILRVHVLASIAGGYTRSQEEIAGFLQQTLCAHQQGNETLSRMVEGIIPFLIGEGMVLATVKGLVATNFGGRIAELYIDPLAGVLLREALHRPEEKAVFPLLHMIARMTEMRRLPLRSSEVDEMNRLLAVCGKALLVPEAERGAAESLLAELKAATLLHAWIEETAEEVLVDRFGVGPGDIRALVRVAEWLLYAAGEIARVFLLEEAKNNLARLRERVSKGVREELLPLVALRGIGRVRARNLFNAGYRTLARLRDATPAELAGVPAVGEGLAQSMLEQLRGGTSCPWPQAEASAGQEGQGG